MKTKYNIFIGLMLVFSILLTACTGDGSTGGVDEVNAVEIEEENIVEDIEDQQNIDDIEEVKPEKEIFTDEDKGLLEEKESLLELNDELQQQNNNGNTNNPAPQTLFNTGFDVMQLIKDKDMVELSNHVHPVKGLSFTPNLHIVIGRDRVFTAQEVAGLAQDTTVYDWGYFLPPPVDVEMHLNFDDYYDQFIYDEDYINADLIGNNMIVNTGDEIDNIDNEFPSADYLEFMFVGPLHSTGSDWRSLKLVFEELNGQKYLIAIVHGQYIAIPEQ